MPEPGAQLPARHPRRDARDRQPGHALADVVGEAGRGDEGHAGTVVALLPQGCTGHPDVVDQGAEQPPPHDRGLGGVDDRGAGVHGTAEQPLQPREAVDQPRVVERRRRQLRHQGQPLQRALVERPVGRLPDDQQRGPPPPHPDPRHEEPLPPGLPGEGQRWFAGAVPVGPGAPEGHLPDARRGLQHHVAPGKPRARRRGRHREGVAALVEQDRRPAGAHRRRGDPRGIGVDPGRRLVRGEADGQLVQRLGVGRQRGGTGVEGALAEDEQDAGHHAIRVTDRAEREPPLDGRPLPRPMAEGRLPRRGIRHGQEVVEHLVETPTGTVAGDHDAEVGRHHGSQRGPLARTVRRRRTTESLGEGVVDQQDAVRSVSLHEQHGNGERLQDGPVRLGAHLRSTHLGGVLQPRSSRDGGRPRAPSEESSQGAALARVAT